MRLHRSVEWVASIAALVLSLGWPAYGQFEKPARPDAKEGPGAAEKTEKDVPLTISDITRMRGQRVSYKKIVEKVAERGVDFKLTAAIREQLRRLGFTANQIDEIKDAYQGGGQDDPDGPGELVPGKGLRTSDAERDATFEEIKKITAASKAEVQPVQARHITLWAAKDVQATFLPDIEKLEKHLRTKCKEPLRSGLDKRSAHIILVKRRYEFESWIDAMVDLVGERFKDPNDPGGNADLKARMRKSGGLCTSQFVIFLLDGQQSDHRALGVGVGFMYFKQLAEDQHTGPLATGFANGTECVLAGTPYVMIFSSAYGLGDRKLGEDPRAWIHLVQQRIKTRKVSTVSQLLKMDTSNMVLPHYAEAWSLVGLLVKQPDKFAALVLKLREEKSPLKAIEDVYGWDEKKLTQEWHKFALAQR